MTNDKQRGQDRGWHVRSTEYPFKSDWLTVRKDTVDVDGEEKQFSYVEAAPGVVIVPVTTDRQILLQQQYRYPVDAMVLGLPAGSMFDSPDASPEDVASKELRQELGAAARELRSLGCFLPSPGRSDERIHVFLALDVKVDEEPEREPGEDIQSRPAPIEEALAMARDGRITDGPSVLALLLAEPLL